MNLHGTITRKHRLPPGQGASEVLGALAIAGSPEQGSPDAEITVTRATSVLRSAQPASPVTFDDLRAGDRVMVLLAGPAQETYPIRGVAAEVRILD